MVIYEEIVYFKLSVIVKMLVLIFYDNVDSDVVCIICIIFISLFVCIVLNYILFLMVYRVMIVKSYRLFYYCEWDDFWGLY